MWRASSAAKVPPQFDWLKNKTKMNTTKTFLAALLLLPLLLNAQSVVNDYTQYVNPFIGTQTDETGALSGSTFPGATMPQGMVQLSPETELMVTWDPCSGYDYNKDII